LHGRGEGWEAEFSRTGDVARPATGTGNGLASAGSYGAGGRSALDTTSR
jgi:hypothetical protein